MTTYIVSAITTTGVNGTTLTLGVMPGSTLPVRISKLEVSGSVDASNLAAVTYTASVYTGSVPSGGSSITPLPLRRGAPAATATAKSNGTISGTNVSLHSEAQWSQNPTAGGSAAVSMNSSYSSPFDVILGSGETVWVAATISCGASATVSVVAAIYFEELELAFSY